MSKPVDPPVAKDRMPSEGTSHDALWVREAIDRLAAYRGREIQAVSLAGIVTKYEAS